MSRIAPPTDSGPYPPSALRMLLIGPHLARVARLACVARLARLAWLAWLAWLACLSSTLFAAEPESLPARQVAAVEGGRLFRFGEQQVLVVRGTPRAMGRAHGTLLREQVRENVRAFLHEWALGSRGRTRSELQAIWDRLAPHVPRRYHEELEGLAEGCGVPLEDLRLLHAIPSRYHCTGTAAMPEVTRGGKVFHTRSLDYALDIGDRVRPQSNALLHVAVPEDGIAHAIVSWAGFLGCVTGISEAGVSVGEMGSSSSDESWDGIPMIFLLREVLWRARSLEQAKAIWTEGPRTCGFNFIFCDRASVCAVEVNRSRIRFFGPGDEAEAVPPHYPIDGVVRRCNHFVDPDLAATQREVYDPRKSAGSSWMAYEHQGRFLEQRLGRIDAETMIALLREYPATHPCLHQAVLCPSDGSLWVSHARDPAVDPLAGAQNQRFLRYRLRDLLSAAPGAALAFGTDRSVPEGVETGRVESERAIEGPFAHPPEAFAYRLAPLRRLGRVTIGALTYPSPGPTRTPENATVHAEYFRPDGEGPFPGAIVLHISDGRFYVARMLASSLSQRGVASLFVKLPYYGERRPEGTPDPKTMEVEPEDVSGVIRQAVRDVRRGAAWLSARGEVDPGKLGIVGVSLGSFVAQLAAGAGDGAFDRCVFVLGGGSMADALYSGSRETRKVVELFEQRGWSRERVTELLAPLEPLKNRSGIDPKGVLMVNCLQDEVVPPESTRRYWEALGRPAIVWYEGGHYALKDHVFEVVARITGHLAR